MTKEELKLHWYNDNIIKLYEDNYKSELILGLNSSSIDISYLFGYEDNYNISVDKRITFDNLVKENKGSDTKLIFNFRDKNQFRETINQIILGIIDVCNLRDITINKDFDNIIRKIEKINYNKYRINKLNSNITNANIDVLIMSDIFLELFK